VWHLLSPARERPARGIHIFGDALVWAGALADVITSLLAGFQVPGMVNLLDLPSARKVCLLLVDGLGWRLLRTYEDYSKPHVIEKKNSP
jgi:hypothetical protein